MGSYKKWLKKDYNRKLRVLAKQALIHEDWESYWLATGQYPDIGWELSEEKWFNTKNSRIKKVNKRRKVNLKWKQKIEVFNI